MPSPAAPRHLAPSGGDGGRAGLRRLGAGAVAGGVSLLGVLTGACCPCGETDTLLCERCCAALLAPSPRRVDQMAPRLQIVRAPDELDAPVVADPLMPVWARADYEDRCRDVILAYKNRGHAVLADLLVRALAPAVDRLLAERGSGPDPCVVSLPSSRGARRRRRADPTGALVTRTARILDLPYEAGLLDLAGQGHQSDRDSRSRAVRRLRTTRAITAPVILIDDVLTTGATLRGAHDALSAARIEVIGGAVVAVTPHRVATADETRDDEHRPALGPT